MRTTRTHYKPDARVNHIVNDLTVQGPNKGHDKTLAVNLPPTDTLPVAPYNDDHANRNWYRRTFGRYPNDTGARDLSLIRAQSEVFKANHGRYPHERAGRALGALALEGVA